jgi:hypothetical protein
MEMFMAVSCYPTVEAVAFQPAQFYRLLLEGYLEASQAAVGDGGDDWTLVLLKDMGECMDKVYVKLATGPGAMRRRMRVVAGLDPCGVLRHGAEGEDWAGSDWRRVTFSV